MKFNTKLAITINVAALAWALFTFNHVYIGAAIAVSVVIWFIVYAKKRQDKLENDFNQRFANQNVRLLDKYAVLKCHESCGYSQVQGVGYLVLTDDILHFEMGLLDKDIQISTSDIFGIEETRRLLGVGTIRLMLRIMYKNSEGENDSIALFVKDKAKWTEEISRIINNNRKPRFQQHQG